ncbi:MAG: KH domain-containing protein [Ruminococcus sp.]|nr:KH domain-containing protein [Ruminococcus sp.]
MKELLYSIVAGLVDNKDAIEITEDAPNEEGVVVFHLHVAEDDMGRVIGKQGRIAKAIRTIMRSGAAKNGMDAIAVEIG